MRPLGQRRSRIRYKRLTAVGASCAITAVALLGGTGVLPADQETRPVAQATLSAADSASAEPGAAHS